MLCEVWTTSCSAKLQERSAEANIKGVSGLVQVPSLFRALVSGNVCGGSCTDANAALFFAAR